jgi:hypothetical protein
MQTDKVTWVKNEDPIKFWKALDILYIIGYLVVISIYILIITLRPFPFDFTYTSILGVVLIIFWTVVVNWARKRNRRICPLEIGFSKKGVELKYRNGSSKLIKWQEIYDVKVLGPDWPSMFGIIQAIIYIDKGKPFLEADIFNSAAKELRQQFEEHTLDSKMK